MAKCYVDKQTGIFYYNYGLVNVKDLEINKEYVILILNENYYNANGVVRINKVTFSNEILLLNSLLPINNFDDVNDSFNVYGNTLEERLSYFEKYSFGDVCVKTVYREGHKCIVLEFTNNDTIERLKQLGDGDATVYFDLIYSNSEELNKEIITSINIKIEESFFSIDDFIHNLFLKIPYIKEILETKGRYSQGIYSIPFENCKESLVFLKNCHSHINNDKEMDIFEKKDMLRVFFNTTDYVPECLNMLLGVNYEELYKLIIINKK